MVINNIYITNTTKMSLSDRFTILQSIRPVLTPQRQRQAPVQDGDLRNRRLLERLALKPIVEAASSIQKIPVKQRIGAINRINPQRRGNLWNFNKRNPQNGRRSMLLKRTNSFTNVRKTRQMRKQKFLARSNSLGNLNRSNSMGNVNQGMNTNNRSFRRGKNIKTGIQTRQLNVNNSFNNQINGNFVRGRGARRRGVLRGQNAGKNTNEINLDNDNVGLRGRGYNRKRGINRSWFAQKSSPTKDELDKQLDLYMAGTRSHLDKELDVYMSSAMEVE